MWLRRQTAALRGFPHLSQISHPELNALSGAGCSLFMAPEMLFLHFLRNYHGRLAPISCTRPQMELRQTSPAASLLHSILSSTITVFIPENTPLLFFSTLMPGDPEIALINQSSDNEQ